MSVLIVNARVTRVDAPAAPSVSGEPAWTNGAAIAVEATLDQPTGSQKLALGADIKDATAVLYVLWSEMPAAGSIVAGYRVVANLIVEGVDLGSVNYRVLKRSQFVFEELTHLQMFLEELP